MRTLFLSAFSSNTPSSTNNLSTANKTSKIIIPLPLITHCNCLPCDARNGSFLDNPAQTSYPASMIAEIFLAGVGGFAGSALRCAAGFVPVKNPAGFPIKTFLINVAGCFIFAAAGCIASRRGSLSPRALAMIRTGFCGGFTTFSAFAAESAALLKGGNYAAAAAYIAASVAAGLFAVFAAERAFGN